MNFVRFVDGVQYATFPVYQRISNHVFFFDGQATSLIQFIGLQLASCFEFDPSLLPIIMFNLNVIHGFLQI